MNVPNLPTYDKGHEDLLFGAIRELAAPLPVIDPESGTSTFGPESDGYIERQAIKDAKSAERKAKRTEKDAKYNYDKPANRNKSRIRGRGGESGRSSGRSSGRRSGR